MRLRNIPGAKEAIENSRFVVHQVQEKKGKMEPGLRKQ